MYRPKLTDILALAIFALVAVIPFHPERDETSAEYRFELQMSSTATGKVRLYFDDGEGLRESLTSSSQVFSGTELVEHRLRVPTCELRAIRVDPIDAAATIELTDARIVSADGAVVRRFAPGDFRPEFEIEKLEIDGDRLRVVTTPGSTDSQLRLSFDPPLRLESRLPTPLRVSTWRSVILFTVATLLLVTCGHRPGPLALAGRVRAWVESHPKSAIAVTACVAATASCHPVVFLGRSFVSPNFSDGTVLLYDRFPTLPGQTDPRVADANGADVGAMAWSHHPLSIVEHRAIFRDGEIPLWNRYNSAGATLLGQGQSMFGEPIHFIPVIFNGAAWVWDAKYLLARWLFACGLGLIVLRVTRHTPAALITALSSAFVGFFLFRVNHPAYFSFCYAPWMLYAWVRIADAPTARRALPWIGALILANFTELTSGTAKEAYMLLISLNFTGAIMLLLQPEAWRTTLGKLVLGLFGGILFVMLSAPVWLTFADALARTYTSYNRPLAFQILPTLIPGLFDELFYRPIHAEQRTLDPSANFLVLAGVLYVLVTIRRVRHDRMLLALALGMAVPFILAFGLVPPQWIVRIPYLGNVAHIDNTFSCVLIIHLVVLAGYGYRTAAARLATPEGRGDITLVAVLLVAMFIPYIAYMHTILREPFGPGTVYKVLTWGQRIDLSPFVLIHLVVLPAAIIAGLVLVRRSLLTGRWSPAACLGLAACATILLWRHAQQPSNAFKPYVYSPATRVDFHATSPAIEYIKAQTREPCRAAGFNGNLFPGWSAVYDVEGISGPDPVTNPHFREFAEVCGITRVWDWRLFVDAESLARARRALDAIGVRFYLDLATEDPRITRELTRVHRADLDVYESTTAWPRAFFTDRVATYAEPEAFARLLREGDGRPFAAIQAFDASRLPGFPSDLAGRTITPAGDYVLTNNDTSFTVAASGPGLIVLQEAWLKGDFQVTLNGKPAKYVRINHAFKGVAVEQAGTYRVTIAYWPRFFTGSLVAAGVALGVIGVIATIEIRAALRRRQLA